MPAELSEDRQNCVAEREDSKKRRKVGVWVELMLLFDPLKMQKKMKKTRERCDWDFERLEDRL